MISRDLVKRYIIFAFGLLLTSFGVAFVTKASLGTSPISAIPYSLSLIVPELSFGTWNIIFSILLITAQAVLVPKDVKLIDWILMGIISVLFGIFIDFSMFLLNNFSPVSYPLKLLSLLFGCCIIGCSVCFQLIANVVMLPGDAFVRAVTKVTKKEFGRVRVISDSTMALTAALLCIIFLQQLVGVREGTVIAALITGNLVKVFMKVLRPIFQHLLPEKETASSTITEPVIANDDHFVLTISREYGSGGREIGKRVAEMLEIPYYDSNLIRLAVIESGFDEQSILNKEERLKNPLLHDFYAWYAPALREEDLPEVDKIFLAEKQVILNLAAKESCVIVGRLANLILGKKDNYMHVFITAGHDAKVRRVMNRDKLSEPEAEKQIKKVEKERENHCKYFFDKEWRNCDNYDFSVRSDKLGIDKSVNLITELALKVIMRH